MESQLTILLGEKLVLQDLHQTSEHRLVGCWSLYPCCCDHRARFSTNTASALRKCRPVAAAPAGEIISGQQNPWRNQHQLPKQGATLSFFFFKYEQSVYNTGHTRQRVARNGNSTLWDEEKNKKNKKTKKTYQRKQN